MWRLQDSALRGIDAECACGLRSLGSMVWIRDAPSAQKGPSMQAAELPVWGILDVGSNTFRLCVYRLEPGEPLAAFTILTQEADERIAHIHDRMPVLLPAQWAEEWLSQTADPTALLDRARGAVGVHACPM